MVLPDNIASPEPHETQPLRGKLAVITATSRGIGAEIAVSLAEVGVDIVGNHIDPRKATKQDGTATRVLKHGVSFNSVLADISESTGRNALLKVAAGDQIEPRGIDFLILNAAGGLERGKPKNWPEQINIVSQHALIDRFLPYMNSGGKIVFMTSLWAHGYGDLQQLPAYGQVASTKHRFEQELRSRIPELQEKGIDVGIVVEHVIKGTAAHTLFSRSAKAEMARLEQMVEGGEFPEAADVGRVVRDMMLSGFESGHTVYVGGTNAEKIDKTEGPLTREEIHKKLPMYSDERLLVDTFELVDGEGRGTYTVRPRDTEGHFTGPFEDMQLWRGVEQLESLAQTMGLTVIETEGDTGALGVFREVRGGVQWSGMVFPEDTVELRTVVTNRTAEGAIGDGEIRVDDTVVMKAEGIVLGIIPDEKTARRLVRAQRAQRSEQ